MVRRCFSLSPAETIVSGLLCRRLRCGLPTPAGAPLRHPERRRVQDAPPSVTSASAASDRVATA